MDRPSDLLPIYEKPPQDVRVTNWPQPPGYGKAFFDAVRREYTDLRRQAAEDQVPIMRYHSPAGEEINVARVSLDHTTDTLIFYGDDGSNHCVVLAQAHSVQLVLKIVPASAEPAERHPVAFTGG